MSDLVVVGQLGYCMYQFYREGILKMNISTDVELKLCVYRK